MNNGREANILYSERPWKLDKNNTYGLLEPDTLKDGMDRIQIDGR